MADQPKEGDVRTTIEKYERIPCELCGEPGDNRVTYLLKGTRSNPASSAYRKDDCSWCSDAETVVCKGCTQEAQRNPPEGYVECSTFYGDRFPHMIRGWVKKSTNVIPRE